MIKFLYQVITNYDVLLWDIEKIIYFVIDICGLLINAAPHSACNDSLEPPPNEFNQFGKWILLVPRYTLELNCTFEIKVRMAELKG